MSRIDIIAAELASDPLSRGYSGMEAEEAAADGHTAYRTHTRTTLTGTEMFEAFVPADLAVLSAGHQRLIAMVVGLGGQIPVGPGTNARASVVEAFGVESATAIALLALLPVPQTRWDELGVGRVTAGDILLGWGV